MHSRGVGVTKFFSVLILSIVSTVSITSFSSSALAAKVIQVKDKKLMLSLDGEAATSGSEYFVINASGKKVAIIVVKQVKGNKAVAEITKGTARPGYTIAPRPGGSAAGGSGSAPADSGDSYYEKKLSQRDRNGNSFGILGGYLMNTMTATFVTGNVLNPTRVTANMSGSGFGVLGYYDYMFSPTIAFRGTGGLEQYKVAGSISTADCNGTVNCTVDLNYLSLYGSGRWVFLPGKYKGWVGGGFGYLYAIGKASSVLRQDQITANQIFVLSLGLDVRLSPKNYVPVSLEYGLFPSSDSVKASIIYLRAGYAWNL